MRSPTASRLCVSLDSSTSGASFGDPELEEDALPEPPGVVGGVALRSTALESVA